VIINLINKYQFSRRFQVLLIILISLIFLLVISGGIMSADDSISGCPDWPTCFGRWLLPLNSQTSPDYLHRFTTAIIALFSIPLLLITVKNYRKEYRVLLPVLLFTGLFIAQVLIGVLFTEPVKISIRNWITPVHFGLSLVSLAALLSVLVFTISPEINKIKSTKIQYSSSLSIREKIYKQSRILILLSSVAYLILLISGSTLTGKEISTACTGWPICEGNPVFWNSYTWMNMGHRFIVLISAVLLAILNAHNWRNYKHSNVILVASTASLVLFISQALLGVQMVVEFPAYLLVLHRATAVTVFIILVILAYYLLTQDVASEYNSSDIITVTDFKSRILNYFKLTKPVVVALLLVTTFAGMVIAEGQWPSKTIVFWTLLSGFLAAGGSGAINQYIDRIDDRKMQRTQKRPIPSGQITPAEGLAFGTAAVIISFFIMVAFVNVLAALLTLVGIIYYVVFYSLILKKSTVQNIVIGGGAGAIPPLVGWAAVTNGLNVPSLFLFAIIFIWTPPHFWALALVRRKDYARAGVPMLPVIRGEKETRWQILIYTIQLVILTLLMPLFGLGESIYLIGASLLGIWILLSAWRVWSNEGNKVAWKMYRYSSMYLAFLFIVLMADRLLLFN